VFFYLFKISYLNFDFKVNKFRRVISIIPKNKTLHQPADV